MSDDISHLADLKPDPKNARRHTPRNVGTIVDAMHEVGAARSIVIDDDGTILAGNATVEAAAEAGIERVRVVDADGEEIVAVRRRGLTPEQKTRLALFDNRSAELADWNADVLASLADDGVSFEGLFTEDELADLVADADGGGTEGLTDPDDVPEPPEEPVTKRGDLVLMGKHRLLCGDSTMIDDVERLMGGRQADMVWTDPPYGVSYEGKTKDALKIENDSLDTKELEDFLSAALTNAWSVCREGAAWYVAAPPAPLHLAFAQVLHDIDVWRQTLIWVKDAFVLGHSDYHYRHEPLFYGWKQGAAHRKPMVAGEREDRTQDSIWEIPRPKRSAEHPTMKPVELIERAISNSSKPGWCLLDTFAGSGSSLIAAEQTGRMAYVMEIDPKYCDVIVGRWERFTGQKAERPS